jgi:hypothetical protein
MWRPWHRHCLADGHDTAQQTTAAVAGRTVIGTHDGSAWEECSHLSAPCSKRLVVCIVRGAAPSTAMIERFDAPTPALLRQAEVARCLRANGWTVIDHGAALRIHEAT